MATGRKTVVVGQVIDPVLWGNPLWDQSVQQFATAADRTTQFPNPLLGAVTWLDDVKRIDVWDGTAWKAVRVPPTYAHLGRSTNTAVAGAAEVVVSGWDLQDVTAGIVENTGVVTVSLPGLYSVTALLSYGGTTDSPGVRQVFLCLNGTSAASRVAAIDGTSNPNRNTSLIVAKTLKLAANDTLQLRTLTSQVPNSTLIGGASLQYFNIDRVGAAT